MKLRIGTRGSKLALWQAHFTQQELLRVGVDSELIIIKTQGDNIQHLGFDKLEGKGFFTKEIEDALLRGEVDVAVHSMKDLPTTPPAGLVTTAVSYRENPSDLLLIKKSSLDLSQDFRFKKNATIGTSSARRKAQMKALRPDIILKDIRGNVPTRIEKLRTQDFDAILLAAAGVKRLGLDLSDLEVLELYPKEFVPAPAQGVLAWQVNENDFATRRIFKMLHHADVSKTTNVERRVLQMMDGGCQLPLGVYCESDEQGWYHVTAACEIDGKMRTVNLSASTSVGLSELVLEKLKTQGTNA